MLRRLRRAAAMGFALAACVLHLCMARLRGPLSLEGRAQWLHECARRTVARLGIRSECQGQAPARGLVVSNHLSYLDILLFSAAMPCCFVSKSEIGGWPFFGSLARAAGTIFLDRSSHASASAVAGEISARLRLGVPILLFPEGTSTDGRRVLRFHSRLLEPAAQAGAPITAAAVSYAAQGGVEERELCWYGDEAFMANLWRLMGFAGLSAKVCFAPPKVYSVGTSAAQTHAEVEAMRRFGAERAEQSMDRP
jgi:1-acyl-sn-glycerol-3-phosphate acyltransferase